MSTSTASVRRGLGGAAAGSLLLFLLVAEQVLTDGPFVRFDRNVMDRIAHHHLLETLIHFRPVSGRFVAAARSVTLFGDVVFLGLVAIGVGIVLIGAGRRRSGWFVIGALFGGACVNVVVRVGIAHTRPEQPFPYVLFGRHGMPSGHAMDVTVCAGAIVIAVWPMLSRAGRIAATGIAAVVVVGVSLSRLVLLVHQVSDVVGGVALGLAWVFGLAAVVAPWEDQIERGGGASVSIW